MSAPVGGLAPGLQHSALAAATAQSWGQDCEVNRRTEDAAILFEEKETALVEETVVLIVVVFTSSLLELSIRLLEFLLFLKSLVVCLLIDDLKE